MYDVTYEEILERMLARVSDKFDKREGSVVFDTASPAAVEFQRLYVELNTLIAESYADSASREALIRRCLERGITPYEATKAVLKGVFTPKTIDVTGQRFNIGQLNYVVLEKIADGEYQVQCESSGIVGNQHLGTMIPIDYIENLETAELTEVLIPGEDEEDTEDLRRRYFDSFQVVAFGGNVRDYIEKTNAIPGVGSTKVTRSPNNSGGTVLLTIIDSTFNAASNALINSVKQLIDPTEKTGEGFGIAPIGHKVTVESAAVQQIKVGAQLTLESGFSADDVIAPIKAAIGAYLAELRAAWGDTGNLVVRVSQIETRLLSVNGVVDSENITVNDEHKNIILSANQIPVLGEVTIS